MQTKKTLKRKKKRVKQRKISKDDLSWINDSSIFKVSTAGLP